VTDDVAAKLASIVEAQQQQIDDVHRLLVNLSDAVLAQGGTGLSASLDRHSTALETMMDRNEAALKAMRERAEQAAALRKHMETGG
jgi:molybdopterin biosynthesis enzyme MoaB